MSEVFRYEGDSLDDFLAYVDRFVSELYLQAAKHGMEQALLYLHSKLPDYPSPPPEGYASQFWTDKQRRWFFWALKHGLVEAEYTRTGTLGRQFTTDVRVVGVEVLGEIGTVTEYAPWVVGPPRESAISVGGVQMFQAAVHEGRWWRFFDVVKRHLDPAYAVMVDEVWAFLERAFYG